jgi:hypothetical protein
MSYVSVRNIRINENPTKKRTAIMGNIKVYFKNAIVFECILSLGLKQSLLAINR